MTRISKRKMRKLCKHTYLSHMQKQEDRHVNDLTLQYFSNKDYANQFKKEREKNKAEKNGTSAVANMPRAWKTVDFGGTGTPHRSDWFLQVSIRPGGTGTPLRSMLTCRLISGGREKTFSARADSTGRQGSQSPVCSLWARVGSQHWAARKPVPSLPP